MTRLLAGQAPFGASLAGLVAASGALGGGVLTLEHATVLMGLCATLALALLKREAGRLISAVDRIPPADWFESMREMAKVQADHSQRLAIVEDRCEDRCRFVTREEG